MFKKTVSKNVNTIQKVKDFVASNASFNGNIYVKSGKFIIDGKSIIGMFSLDLIKDLEIEIESDSQDDIDRLIASWGTAGI